MRTTTMTGGVVADCDLSSERNKWTDVERRTAGEIFLDPGKFSFNIERLKGWVKNMLH